MFLLCLKRDAIMLMYSTFMVRCHMAGIRDVDKLAGVSPATVSRTGIPNRTDCFFL